MQVGIIGIGNIGQEIMAQVLAQGWDIVFALNTKGVHNANLELIDAYPSYEKYLPQCDLVFLSIPSGDDGVRAYRYIDEIVGLGIPVVTCEKGAMANYYHKLEKYLDLISFNATVGGGSRVLDFVKAHQGKNMTAVYGVINGTLNFLLDELSHGRNPQRAVNRAVAQGYTEPQAKKLAGVIGAESEIDIPNKTAILFNHLNLSPNRLRARYFKPGRVSDEELERLLKEPKVWRYIVSLTQTSVPTQKIGGFDYTAGGWHISAGFRHVNDHKIYSELILPDVQNKIILIDSKDKKYSHQGPGAGRFTTVKTMIEDATKMLKK